MKLVTVIPINAAARAIFVFNGCGCRIVILLEQTVLIAETFPESEGRQRLFLAPPQNPWVKIPVRNGLCPETRGFGRHGIGMLMLPFERACAASLNSLSPGMNEPEKSCGPSLLWGHIFNLHMPSTR